MASTISPARSTNVMSISRPREPRRTSSPSFRSWRRLRLSWKRPKKISARPALSAGSAAYHRGIFHSFRWQNHRQINCILPDLFSQISGELRVRTTNISRRCRPDCFLRQSVTSARALQTPTFDNARPQSLRRYTCRLERQGFDEGLACVTRHRAAAARFDVEGRQVRGCAMTAEAALSSKKRSPNRLTTT